MDINDGLIGFWNCNTGSGPTAFDRTIYGNDGALEGTNPTWVDGKAGKAVNLPGLDERINCGNLAPLDQIGNGSFWIPLWMKSKSTSPTSAYEMFFFKEVDGNNRVMLSTEVLNNIVIMGLKKGGVGVNVSFSVNTDIWDTLWNHLVFVINRTTDKALLYINKVKDIKEIDISSCPADCSNAADVIWGGRFDGSAYAFGGALDELRIYLGLPTQEKIDFLHDHPDGRQPTQVTPRLISSLQADTPNLIIARNDPELSIVKSTVITAPKIIGDKLPDRGRS